MIARGAVATAAKQITRQESTSCRSGGGWTPTLRRLSSFGSAGTGILGESLSLLCRFLALSLSHSLPPSLPPPLPPPRPPFSLSFSLCFSLSLSRSHSVSPSSLVGEKQYPATTVAERRAFWSLIEQVRHSLSLPSSLPLSLCCLE